MVNVLTKVINLIRNQIYTNLNPQKRWQVCTEGHKRKRTQGHCKQTEKVTRNEGHVRGRATSPAVRCGCNRPPRSVGKESVTATQVSVHGHHKRCRRRTKQRSLHRTRPQSRPGRSGDDTLFTGDYVGSCLEKQPSPPGRGGGVAAGRRARVWGNIPKAGG